MGTEHNENKVSGHELGNSESTIRHEVRHNYANIAKQGGVSCCGNTGVSESSCCGSATSVSPSADEFASELGYSPEDLAHIPQGANMALSCGNPTAIASLKPGETVLDLGSGGGFDVFLAGPKVGKAGRVIGVDMTPEMLEKARGNIASYSKSSGLDNVEFRLGEIEHLPVGDSSVDVIISNCVINLSTNKQQVWREMARVLKPGGRVAVSDIALLKPLPEEVLKMIAAYVGCIAGAVHIDEYQNMIRESGFENIQLQPKTEFMDSFIHSGDPLAQEIMQHLPDGLSPSDFITSVNVSAKKPG